MNSEIRKLINKRFKQLERYRRTKEETDKERYKEIKNKVTKELRIAEQTHWKKLLEKCDSLGGEFLKIYNKMTCKEKKQKRIGPIKNHHGVLVFDDTDKQKQ